MMWDSPLYAMNMFYYHWLIKKMLWPMAGQNIARQESQTETGKKKVGTGKGKQLPEKQDVR